MRLRAVTSRCLLYLRQHATPLLWRTLLVCSVVRSAVRRRCACPGARLTRADAFVNSCGHHSVDSVGLSRTSVHCVASLWHLPTAHRVHTLRRLQPFEWHPYRQNRTLRYLYSRYVCTLGTHALRGRAPGAMRFPAVPPVACRVVGRAWHSRA